MREIPLRARDGSIRAYALVDDEDYESLIQWRWYLAERTPSYLQVQRTEYAGWDSEKRKGRSRTVTMHRQIMGFPPTGVDHVDRNPLNNQRSNLRLATQKQNNQNRHARRAASSGVRGVSRCGERWAAQAQVDGHQHWLGQYATIEEAARVVRAFRAEHMPYSEEARDAVA